MAHNNLLVFIIFLLEFLTNTLEVDNIDNLSQELIVSLDDCTKMQNNQMYSLNKIDECKISLIVYRSENLYIRPATISLYRKNFRINQSATM